MNYFLYKIQFDESSEELSSVYERLSEHEKEKISQMDVMSSFDCENQDKKYICYLLTTKTEIISYKNILNNNLISYICEDISQSVIDNQINLEKDLIEYLNSINYLSYELFIEEISDWIYDNLDTDSILDRINKFGIDSLRPIDKYFLLQQGK